MARKPATGAVAPPRKYSIVRLYWVGLLLFAAVPMLALGYFWVADQYATFREQSVSLRQSYLDTQEQYLRREADEVVDYIAFKNGEIEQRLRDSLKEAVNATLLALTPEPNAMNEVAQQRARARAFMKKAMFGGGSDHLFLIDADGVVLLMRIDQSSEGHAAAELVDANGAHYLQSALRQARAQGEAYATAWLPKPAGPRGAYSAQIYLRYFPALGIFVGGIGYVEDRVQATQQEVLARFRAVAESDLMVSIVDYDGAVVLHSDDVLSSGPSLGDLRDADGQSLMPLLTAAIKRPDGLLIRSRWLSPGTAEPDGYLQMNYARAYPSWRWIVTTGFALHELDVMLDQQRAALKQRVQQRIAYVGLALGVLLVLASLFAQHLSNRTRRALQQFNRAFEESSRSNSPIDLAQLPLREFDRLAVDANRMLDYRVGIEQELVAARITAESANHAKSQFLSTMSHELRTPLNGVLGYAQILMRDPQLTPEQHRHLIAIENCGQHLLTLINDVLDLAKIESGALQLQPRDCNLHRLLQSVGDIVRGKAESKSLAFRLEMAPNLPEYIWLDEVKLRQVLINLLGNAVKFTDSGSVVLSARLHESGSRVIFDVTDTGIGISRQRLQEIFQPFRQAHDHAGGSGLGLAISERVSRAMGGELTAESALGAGSCFSLQLPYVAAVAPAVVPPPERMLNLVKPALLMVVDDNPANRMVLAGLLRSLGCDVIEAENGLEALVKLRTQPVPLVFMDVRMALMDGIETTRRIKQDPDLKHIVVIAVSASVFPEVVEQMQEAGCNDFISKPVQFSELAEKLSQHLDIALRQGPQMAAPPLPSVRLDQLPPELQRTLQVAIAEGDLAAMYSTLTVVEQRGYLSRELVQSVRAMLDNFDLEAVRDLLAPVTAPL